ncbi:AMP-binding protein [Streptomyces fuscigenes]|uniref:AMP-binding protein n=1 Tax=Streptomyces fuscigenes TaxID=1528880 RepID=UPI001F3EC49B|nr:AMP-binding protein [Streptomyces fuscigenes]MCF3962649.1 AMP-binding protein [Streptomyces fuscigenes]
MDEASTPGNYTTAVLERLRARGDRDSIVVEGRRISGSEAHGTVLEFAAALRAAGLRPGDGVALFALNSPEALLLEIAAHFVGCRLVFVPLTLGRSELGGLIGRAEVKVLLFDPAVADRALPAAEQVGVPRVFSIGPCPGAVDFPTTAKGGERLAPDEAAHSRHVATLFYTGGTTGRPKLVVHRHRHYEELVRDAEGYLSTASDPSVLTSAAVTHASGHRTSLVCILTGQTIVLMRSFDAGATLSLMESEQVTGVMLVTGWLYELLDHPDCLPGRFPALQRLFYSGAAAAPERLRQAIERFGPVLHQLYGASETGSIAELMPWEHDPARPVTLSGCGSPSRGVEVQLRDEDGKTVAAGEPGELYLRARNVMEGYWRDPERTAEVLDEEGWFRSGDIARQDEDGHLYLIDRARDVIVCDRTAGNVYSRLLDDFLAAYPGIAEAATVGLPDGERKEAVHVVLVLADPDAKPDLPTLTDRITEALGEDYAPASYSFALSLPRTAVGKTDKKALRASLAPAGV